MTIALKLDAGAVAKLFASDDAKLDLQQAVIAEICRRLFENYISKDVLKIIQAVFGGEANTLIDMIKENETFKARFEKMFETALVSVKKDAWRGDSYTLKPEAKKKLDEALKTQTDQLMKDYGITGEQMIQAAANAAFERVSEKAMANIDDRINRKIAAITNEEIDRRVEVALRTALKVAKA
ncbi:hypothetical protein J4G48_0040785 [Bradyrhizobium barranii subsp. apii]|uniref:hypothetical protein n=1 Tax=Bradyrhizobium barranii TaxID=2992140 RepID=UPI001AA108F2|nr:hypothetical protein [Bradyrhizobium barranii]UPT95494.1 hypothetical protein J4G48_0040785 [Bradyrhizobium barranii subsp. apii]